MGPLDLADMAGIDVLLAVMEVIYQEQGDSKYRPASLLRKMVRAGFIGRKAGCGFLPMMKKVVNVELILYLND